MRSGLDPLATLSVGGGRSWRPGQFAVAESGAEHRVDDVAAAAGEADDRRIVELAF